MEMHKKKFVRNSLNVVQICYTQRNFQATQKLKKNPQDS